MVRDRLKDLIPKHWRGPTANRLLSIIRQGVTNPTDIVDQASSNAFGNYARARRYFPHFDSMLIDLLQDHRAAAIDYAEYLAEKEREPIVPRRKGKHYREYRRDKPPTYGQLNALSALGVNDIPISRLDAIDMIEAEKMKNPSASMADKTMAEIWG